MHVVQNEGTENDQIDWLLVLITLGVDVGDADRPLPVTVQVDLGDFALGLEREVLLAKQNRQDSGLRTRLGVIPTAELLAEAAICAWTELHPKRVGISTRHVGRWGRERL